MTSRSKSTSAGFSLVEMLIATALLLVVLSGIFALVNPGQGTYAAQIETSDMQQRHPPMTDAACRSRGSAHLAALWAHLHGVDALRDGQWGLEGVEAVGHRQHLGLGQGALGLAHRGGEAVQFDGTLLVADGENVKVGSPTVAGAKVTAEILGEVLGPKLLIFKFRRRKAYRKKTGHRQPFTALKITGITA